MSKPKKFLNKPDNAVTEFISGLLLQYPNKLRKLANHNVILTSNINYDNVTILSGGGSGHEPSHAGWIGEGMLTGAILGGIFASPSVSSILAAIRAVTKVGGGSSKGCLLVIKNYTGDRLNFGQACELAMAEGRNCRMVVVADDCALERTKGITGARGVAGTVLVHKVAGAAAMAGKTLDEVTTLASSVALSMGSLGVALDAVTIPGAESVNDRLDEKTIEIGLGIHGEAGIRQSELLCADDVGKVMVDTIQQYGTEKDNGSGDVVPLFEPGAELAILVNNLGGTSNFEMSILTHSIVTYLEGTTFGCKVGRVYVGGYMTSFNMHGASLTILPLSSNARIDKTEVTTLLDADCTAPAWVKCDIWDVAAGGGGRPSDLEVQEEPHPDEETFGPKYDTIELTIPDFANKAKKALKAVTETLIANEPLLTEYDTIVGDGDCGLTMKRGGTEIASRVDAGEVVVSHPVPLFSTLADAVSASMGGTSGVLIEVMFRKMSTVLADKSSIDEACVIEAFKAGVEAISFYGGATVGSRTMLDALFPAVSALVDKDSAGDWKKAAVKAREGADGTGKMLSASAGRSNYLRADSLEDTPDPGAVAVALVLESIVG